MVATNINIDMIKKIQSTCIIDLCLFQPEPLFCNHPGSEASDFRFDQKFEYCLMNLWTVLRSISRNKAEFITPGLLGIMILRIKKY